MSVLSPMPTSVTASPIDRDSAVSLKGIDLCSGAGGLSLGFQMAGFEVVAAVENNGKAAAVHRKNFPDCKTIEKSISDLTGKSLLSEIGMSDGEIDIVFGGPPCQGFSVIGKRKQDDKRSAILVEFARLATELSPKVIVAENVSGILMHWAKSKLDEFKSVLATAGYKLLDPWCLNANDFGVPQHRHRVFLVAVKDGVDSPSAPKSPSSYSPPTVWDAIGDLVQVSDNPDFLEGHVYNGPLDAPSSYATEMRKESSEDGRLTCCTIPRHSDEVRERFRNTLSGKQEKISRYYRLPKSGPSCTIRAGTGPENGSFMASRPIHPTLPRCITVREAARLHSFPDSFDFDPQHWHGFRQIGNSVPPLLARRVAEAVLEVLVDGK